MRRVVVGISGSTGSIYGIRLLERLRALADVETHLVISGPGKRTLVEETDYTVRQVETLAHVARRPRRRGLDRERLVPDRRDDRRALLDQDAGGARELPRRHADRTRRRRDD